MFYQEYPCHPGLNNHVRCYWIMAMSAQTFSKAHQRFLAEGIEFWFNMADPIELFRNDSEPDVIHGGCICGPMTQPMRVRPTGRLEMFGVCFRPGGAYPFCPHPTAELVNGYWEGEDIRELKGGSRIVDRIQNNCRTTGERIQLLDRYLLRGFDSRRNSTNITTALEVIEARKGQVNIDRLAKLVGLSARNLERCFKERVGMSPKQLCRSLRFKSVFSHLATYPADSWVSTALACGYHDQAHMIKDFKYFTGTSPAAYFSNPHARDQYFTGNF